jgi:hypothetical protein
MNLKSEPVSPDSPALPPEPALIRASELAQFSFCRRAWWLGQVKGIPSRQQSALSRGTQSHRQHADQVQAALRWQKTGWLLWGGGILLLVIGLVWLTF